MMIVLRLALTGLIATTVALVIACTANQPAMVSTETAPTAAPTLVAQSTPAPTHLPRQHSTEHIEGLGEPIDVAHFIDSFPNHAQTLTQSPARVGINFDLSLTEGSSITLERDGKPIAVGAPEFDSRKIYMSVRVPADTGDGLYLAKYRACLTGSDCSDGQIGFRVDAAGIRDFVDLTGQPEVTIHLQDVRYQPNQIIISPGTTVTWVNDDPFDHFVNSDPHPTHNAFPDLNSLDIPHNETFSFTFESEGEYAFHCSAHVPQNMFGTIIVRGDEQSAVSPTATAPATVVAQSQPSSEPSPTAIAPTEDPTLVSPTGAPPTAVPPTIEPTEPSPAAPARVPESELPPQRFAAHYVSSVPAHADLITVLPERIQLNFDFVLARNSNINMRKDGDKVTLGDLEFSENRLQMSVPFPELGAGKYHVLYRACWPDKSCHDGEFAFVVAP